MSSYIKEIFLHTGGHLRAHNGNGRSANYIGSYDERKSGTYRKKCNKYTSRRTPAVVIVHDPLKFCDGGFIKGATFVEEDWERMRSRKVITENTIFKQNDRAGSLCIWRMVTLKDWRGNKKMRRVKVER